MFRKAGTKHHRRTRWANLTPAEIEKLEMELYRLEIEQIIGLPDQKGKG